jgi:hypothetical protein
VAALNSLQSNFKIIDAIKKSGMRMNELAIPEMIDWAKRAGYEVRPLKRSLDLPVICLPNSRVAFV